MVKTYTLDDNRTIDPIDKYVGQRMRLRRHILGYSQDELAMRVGVTFQQIQKYETSANRIASSRLYHIGRELGIPVAFFFEGLPGQIASQATDDVQVVEEGEHEGTQAFSHAKTMDMISLFWSLPQDEMRQQVMALMETFKGQSPRLLRPPFPKKKVSPHSKSKRKGF